MSAGVGLSVDWRRVRAARGREKEESRCDLLISLIVYVGLSDLLLTVIAGFYCEIFFRPSFVCYV